MIKIKNISYLSLINIDLKKTPKSTQNKFMYINFISLNYSKVILPVA